MSYLFRLFFMIALLPFFVHLSGKLGFVEGTYVVTIAIASSASILLSPRIVDVQYMKWLTLPFVGAKIDH